MSDHKATILLVDDRPANLLALEAILDDPGLALARAGSGEEALRLAEGHDFAAILLDVRMPGMDGLETAQRLRRGIRNAQTPVILITAGDGGPDETARGYAVGAVDYLTKPFSAHEVKAKVRALVQAWEQSQERADAAESRAVTILETMSDGFLAVDRDGRCTYVNAAAERMLGESRELLIGRNREEILSGIHSPSGDWELHRALANQVPVEHGYHHESEGRWFEVRVCPVDSGGLSIYLRDTTERKQAEQAQAHLAAIIESSEDAIISKTFEGVITSWNVGAQRVFGHTAAEAIGQSIMLIIPPDREDEEREILARLRRGERIEHFETVRRRRDGRLVDISLSISPIRDGKGQLIGAAKVARDVTTRKQAERRLATQDSVTRALAESETLGDAAPKILGAVCERLEWELGVLWYVDAQDQLLRCSEAWHSESALAAEFAAVSRERTFPIGDGLPGRVWAAGQALWVPDVSQDSNFPRAPLAAGAQLHSAVGFPILLDSEVLGVIEFFSHEIREPDEDLLQMMTGIGSQIGQFIERARAEQELRASEQRFVRFMENLPGLAWLKDPEGRYLYVNAAAARAFGSSPAEIAGKKDAEIFPPEIAAEFRRNDRRAMASENGILVVETRKRDDGIVYHSLVSKFPILDPDGRRTSLGGVAIDISDRVQAEEALRLADRRKDEFLAMLAHELRNPLAPILTAVEILRLRSPQDPVLDKQHQVIHRQIGQMKRLLDDLLDVSRITRGKIELATEPVDLAAVLTQAMETSRPGIRARQHKLQVSLPDAPLEVQADQLRLSQVFTNLLNNAARYTEPGGTIWLEARREEETARVSVRDSGVGMTPETLAEAFDLFTQGNRGIDRSEGGLGIGLTLARELVEMHGGTIRASSPGLNAGSEFVVTLPLAPRRTSRSAPRVVNGAMQPAVHSGAVPGGCSVLVVDDSADQAEGLAFLLRMAGHEVHVAFDGPSALETARERQPGVGILDIGLPEMDGYQLARRLRQERGLSGMVLVAVTGYGREEDRVAAKEAGFDYHLVKPLQLEEILAVLRSGPDAASLRARDLARAAGDDTR